MKKIIVGIIVAIVIYFVSVNFFNYTQSVLLSVISLLVVYWTNSALSLGVVSLLPIVLFPSFGILTTKATTINYAHPIIYLFLGGFMLAIGVEKTKLHIFIADKILNFFPSTPRGMIFSLSITSALLSSILSNTTTTLLLISIAIFLSDDKNLKMRFALAIAYGASIGGILTPIGTPPNLILLGVMQEHNMEMIPFFRWVYLTAPLVVVMLIVVSLVLGFGVKDVEIQRVCDVKPLDKVQRKVVYLMLALVTLLFINAPIRPYWDGLGLSDSGILLSFGLMLFVPPFNILKWEDDAKKIPYAIMFLFGAGFSIAKAFMATGLADELASRLLSVAHLTPIMILLVIAFVMTFTTEITSNTALTSLMLPVIYSVATQSSIDTTLFMMVATICASYAFMLPIATPPNAIAMGSGAVEVKNMLRYGFILNLIGIFCITIIARFFWSA